MEDQGKRVLLAVGLALGIMVVWQALFPPEIPPPSEEVAEKANTEATNNVVGATPQKTGEARKSEEITQFALPKVEVTFSNWGGSIKSWRLLDSRYVDQENEKPLNMSPVEEEYARALRVEFLDSTASIPVDAVWELKEKREDGITYEWSSADLRVEKRYTFGKADYTIALEVSVENLSANELKQSLAVFVTGVQDPEKDSGGGIGRVPQVWAVNCYAGGELQQATVEELKEDGALSDVGARWSGLVHSYFLTALTVGGEQNGVDRVRCGGWLERDVVPANRGVMHANLRFPAVRLRSGEVNQRQVLAYMGPKYLDTLERLSRAQPRNPHLEKAVDLGWLGFISRPLLSLLKWFYSFVGNWGVAIILMTLTVKLATIYWTHKSMVSMQEMAKLRPQLDKIKEKYAEDQERQRVETMNLFKAHNVNPMASCLPMLLQMPIWFALYRSLMVAAELYRAPFVEGWIDDLTAPDPYYILPIAVTVVMFVQSRLTPQTATGAQQKMMQYGMPLMFGLFSFFFPSGLALYMFTNTLLSATHHFYMHKIRPKTNGPVGERSEQPEPKETPKTNRQPSQADGNGQKSKNQKRQKKRKKTKKS